MEQQISTWQVGHSQSSDVFGEQGRRIREQQAAMQQIQKVLIGTSPQDRRIDELQAKGVLTPGEEIELRMLLDRKWKGI